jgi:hypothetical protein
MRKAAHQRFAVGRLELVHATAIDNAGNHFAHIVTGAGVAWNDAVQFARIVERFLRFAPLPRRRTPRTEVCHNRAHNCQGVKIILRQIVGNAGDMSVHHGAAEFLGADFFPGRCLDQRRTAEKDCASAAHNHHLIAHRWHIRAASRARSHHRCNLSNASGRHPRLIVKNAPEVVAVGEDVCLERQERAAAIDQIDAGEMVLFGDFLRAQVLFHRQRIICTAFDGCIIGDDHHFAPGDAPDAGDDASGRDWFIIDLVGCQSANFEEGSRRIDQAVDPFAHQQFAA